jgi:magnesium chelatase subunit H
MKPKRTSAADRTPIRVVLVTMDPHLASAATRAQEQLRQNYPGLTFTLHAAAEWGEGEAALARVREDIARADILIATMLFLEDHFKPVLEALAARRDHCDAMVCAMSAGEITRLTRMGDFAMDGSRGGALALLKKLRPKPREGGGTTGAQTMKMLRRIPKILRFIPGTAQDVRAYFTTLQYWLAGSEANLVNMIRLLVDRYAAGERKGLRGRVKVEPPVEYPEVGLYHPRVKGRVTARLDQLPGGSEAGRTVGLLVLRSYVLAGNTAHYDGVIAALEARGLRVIPAYASGLDARPAIEAFFMRDGRSRIEALVSLTGFSLVGGPAYNDASAAEEILAQLDVPYLVAHPVEFQTLDDWERSERGLLPVESTIMVAIPELDGSTGSMVFGGRSGAESRDMRAHEERAGLLAARVARLVALRREARADRKLAVVLFNFPPNAGNAGTAAYLGVFQSLWNTLKALREQGYTVTLPESVDALREAIIHGNAQRHGAHANVHCRISVEDHLRRERHLRQIEAQWGPAPGRHQADDRSIFVLGAAFGNVFVGLQPGFGYEGDPMRLLFEQGFAPTHAFSAFYRYIREDFGASAVLHFGTHGALEFMPGKQTGLSGACWPDRLIGDLPNLYLYAANNPSEGTIAKRRAAATLVSYLTPPIAHAGLYRGLLDLKDSISQWNGLDAADAATRATLAPLLQSQAAAVELATAEPAWGPDAPRQIAALSARILELEYTLIPEGLHVLGEPMSAAARADMLCAIAQASHELTLDPEHARQLVEGVDPARVLGKAPRGGATLEVYRSLASVAAKLAEQTEVPALLQALDGRYIRPVVGGDVLRTPEILPTGRNLHGFDPFRIPSAFAVREGARQAQLLLDTYMAEGHPLPESVALVLWGTDNLKTEGCPIGQALALMGARPRFDGYGRLAGASLIPLEELGRPRIDVVITLSGIFRDLLPLQIRLLAEAAYRAASAEEPPEMNFVRKHALRDQAAQGCDLETAALRVFGNCEGAYGANVNHLVENGRWEDEDELAEAYTRRKSFAFGRQGRPVQQAALLKSVLADVAVTYQNLDSVELGLTTVDHYFDTLGGITRAVRRAKGGTGPAVYIGDQTQGHAQIRTLAEQVTLETHTRMLNPKWYTAMLSHGYEGVRQIEAHITNTVGWSATTGQVAPWVYKKLTQTYVLDPQMREQLAALNPAASAKVASRLLEASERHYWEPDPETLEALRRAGEELEDRVEGIFEGVAA